MDINAAYKFRFLAQVVIEAKTPLVVGSGDGNIITDAEVAKDVNGMPFVPGTSIAGVLRSLCDDKHKNNLFGFPGSNDEGIGSRVIVSEARIINSENKVMDGLMSDNELKDSLLSSYVALPVRQHVRINAKGVASKSGKFDEQVVCAGTRFCFEIEMIGRDEEDPDFSYLTGLLRNSSFRLGGGTRSGFGNIEIVEMKSCCLNLCKPTDRKMYLNKTSKLEDCFWNDVAKADFSSIDSDRYITYKLSLTPSSFFCIGSGLGDDEVDMTPVKEAKVDWSSGRGVLKYDNVLIPATSFKGALAHRTAYHWNKKHNQFADNRDVKVGDENPAVRLLFGYQDQDAKVQKRGNVLFSDIINDGCIEKIIYHVKIDRLTGGSSKGALFSEKTVYGDDKKYDTIILVDKNCCADRKKDFEEAIEAFELALKDLCEGRLPLGGMSNRGNGVFTGSKIKSE